MLLGILLNFLTASALAALIGAEREMVQIAHITDERRLFGGIRTHILIAVLGGMLTVLASVYQAFWIVGLGLFVIAGFLILNYGHNLFHQNHQGFTTEVTGIITYLLGVLCLSEHANIAVILGILVTIILVSKKYLAQTLPKIDRTELYNTLKFAVILFVILPVLPNQPLDQWGVINLYDIWKVVVIISGVSYVGYILSRIVGTSKGIAISGALGGLASSTAVTSSMAEQSRKNTHILYPFLIATIVASSIMFFRVLVLIYSFNGDLLPSIIIPIIAMAITSSIVVAVFIWLSNRKKETPDKHMEETVLESPFKIIPALKFALFFILVSFLSELASRFLGDQGIFAVSIFSGLADVDAITIKLAQQSAEGVLVASVATKAIISAVITNTIVKLFLAKLFGGKQFGNYIIFSFAIILGVGALSLFFI